MIKTLAWQSTGHGLLNAAAEDYLGVTVPLLMTKGDVQDNLSEQGRKD